MLLRSLFLGILLFAVGCASVNDYRAVRGEDGLYRPQLKKVEAGQPIEPELVLRTQNAHVVTTAAEAEQVLASTPSVTRLLDDSKAGVCSPKSAYRAKEAQFEAERKLNVGRYEEALSALDEAERLCSDLRFISSQDFLRAVALNGLGRKDQARTAAERFLNDASAIQPSIYIQSDGPHLDDVRRSWTQDHERLKLYRSRAEAFLRDGTELNWTERSEVPKFYPNNPFRPGGNRFAGGLVLPAIVEVDRDAFALAAVGYYSWGRTSLQGLYGYSSDTGNWVSARVRRSVYESLNRDLDVDVFGGVRTTKLLRITKWDDWDGSHGKSDVLRSSLDPAVGAGATYRFKPEYGVSGQLGGIANQLQKRIDLQYSLYGFYDLINGISLNAGYMDSNPMVALGIMHVQVGYDFRDETVRVLYQNLAF